MKRRKLEEEFTDLSELEQDFAAEDAEDVEDFDEYEDELDIVESDEEVEDELEIKTEAMPPVSQRKRIEFEDDIVRVYDGSKEIYSGAEDYEPMQDEDWKWDNTNKYYKFDKYIKVCCESSQKRRRCEALSFQDQNKMLEKRVKEVVAAAEHIQERFKYRTLQNMSYTPEQSAKILYKLEDVLLDARDNINKLWNEIG